MKIAENLVSVLSSISIEVDSDSVTFSGNFDSTEGKNISLFNNLVQEALNMLNLDIEILEVNADNRILGENKVWFNFSQREEKYYLSEDEAEQLIQSIKKI